MAKAKGRKIGRPTIDPGSEADFPSMCLAPLGPPPKRQPWESLTMLSYGRPAHVFWDSYCRQLLKLGWTKGEVWALVSLKFTRHALDSDWTDAIEACAIKLAEETTKGHLESYVGNEVGAHEAEVAKAEKEFWG